MKRFSTLFIILILWSLKNQAQLFSGGEKVSIFGIEFRAKEVCGQKNFVGSTDYYRTPLLRQFVSKQYDNICYGLGSYRKNKDVMEESDLFNLSLQDNSYPLLDSIDFDFYKSRGFGKIEDEHKELLNEPEYKSFKHSLTDSAKISIQDKKRILFKSESRYKNLLLSSRYDILKDSFAVDKKKVSKATAELKAQLDTITISTNTELSAKIRVYLSRLADESVQMKGYYVDARLDPGYISKIDFYINNISKTGVGTDQFGYNLTQYVSNLTDAAVNTSLVAIQLEGTLNKTKISIDSVSADLSAKFNISTVEAKRIAVSVNATFTRNEEVTFKNSYKHLFIIRYFTSSIVDKVKFLAPTTASN